MSNRRPPSFTIIFIAFVSVFCLGACIMLGGYLEINRRAEVAFGPPSTDLDPLQRLRLTLLLLYQADQLHNPAAISGDSVRIEIPLGESPLTIASRLETAGIISDTQAFINYLKYSGLDTTLQAGEYSLNPTLNSVEIAHILQDATPSEVTFSILPGWRLEEVAATLPTTGLEITPDEFMSAANAPELVTPLPLEFPVGSSLEGFLYPGSYRIPRQTNIDQLLTILLSEFESQLSFDILDGIQRQGLNIHQAVTLASIVERESIVAEEMPIIASVFLNRLAIGMSLEADSTVQYAVGFNPNQNTWWTNPLSIQDLQFDSPFNTYLYAGLPPGPIANPGSRALRAVAFPAQSPYYYFRATCDDSGRHNFSETFDEHVNNACP
ncbi:MAG: endolytic transglycosylase MltG [Chloroflexota bacterium]|nr:MAG: endolytic transglycosylase MltG [Chloroflexota bacterium]